MKRIALLLSLVALAAVAVDSNAAKSEKQTLNGEYYWVGDRSRGDLRAVFNEAGENAWKVTFFFRFSGNNHRYSGTAVGTLGEGSLQGEVKNENRRRTFTFEGAFKDGVFEGTHAEIRRGKATHMGTLKLN